MRERQPVIASPRDAVLFSLALKGWASESVGSLEGQLGFTAHMSNSKVELPDLLDAEEADGAGVTLDDPRQLVGHWLISQVGVFVEVTGFSSEDEVRAAYARVERLYQRMDSA